MFYRRWNQKPPLGVQILKGHPHAHGLMACWLLNERNGDQVFDLTGDGNNGALTNMDPPTDWIVTEKGPALDFDGITDHVAFGTGVRIAGGATLEVLANLDSNAVTDWVVGVLNKGAWGGDADGDVVLMLETDPPGAAGNGHWSFCIDSTTARNVVRDTIDAPTGEWSHVIGTWDGTNSRIYRDGVLRNTTAQLGTLPNRVTNMVLGTYPGNEAGSAMDGKIALARVWNRAWLASGIRELYADPWAMFGLRWLVSAAVPVGVSDPAMWVAYHRMTKRNVALRI